MGWLVSRDGPGEEEELRIGERTRFLTRLESTSWSCSRGWSFSGEAVAIAATDGLSITRFTTSSPKSMGHG